MTLTEFLLARIAEDEQRVYACDSDGQFRVAWVTFRRRDGSMDYTTVAADHRDGNWCADGSTYGDDSRVAVDAPFYDARRVLAECEAKRRIVGCCTPTDDDSVDWGGDTGAVANGVLRLLAQPYADHPDFREEWRP